MKKILISALAVLLVFSMASCGDKDETESGIESETVESSVKSSESESEPAESGSESGTETEPQTESESEFESEPLGDKFIDCNETVYVFNVEEVLNIRAEPAATATKVGEMHEGESTVRTGYNNGWSRILFEGKVLYAKSDYLTTAAPLSFTDKLEKVYVTADQLNLRSKPIVAETATIIVSVKYGDELERTGVSKTKDETGSEWSRILYNGQVCYANSAYLSITPGGAKTLAFDPMNDMVYVIAETSLLVRSDASLGDNQVGVLKYGDALERTGIATAPDKDGITWSRVIYNGRTCYISSSDKYISTKKTVTFDAADETLYVIAESTLNLHVKPEYESGVVRAVKRGVALQCTGKAQSVDADDILWYRVVIEDQVCYASSKFLAATKPTD